MKEYKEINESKKKVGIKLYVFLFIILYFLLEIGFTGYYTYTTPGVFVTCLMFFSIYFIFNIVYVFLKFKSHEISVSKKESFIKSILKRIVILTSIVIVLFTAIYICKYINTMNGIKKEIEDFNSKNVKTNVIQTIENKVENSIDKTSKEENSLNILEGMLETNVNRESLSNVYKSFNDNLGKYILFRVLVDIVDIAIVIIIVCVLDRFVLDKVIREKEDTDIKNNKEVLEDENENKKLTKEELLDKLREDENSDNKDE